MVGARLLCLLSFFSAVLSFQIPALFLNKHEMLETRRNQFRSDIKMAMTATSSEENERVSRKHFCNLLSFSLLQIPGIVHGEASGSWAVHEGPFTEKDFESFVSTSSGLKYSDVKEGTGPMPASGQKIKAHYSGYLLSGKKFDSSYDRGQPLPFQVGKGQVIKGWDEGLLSMKIGGKRILLIPPELGYGSRSVGGGLIPANSSLVFFVELVTFAA